MSARRESVIDAMTPRQKRELARRTLAYFEAREMFGKLTMRQRQQAANLRAGLRRAEHDEKQRQGELGRWRRRLKR